MNIDEKLLAKQKETINKGKRGILSIVFGRSGVLLFLVLIQMGVLFIGASYIRGHLLVAYESTVLLGFILVVQIINKPGNPVFKIAWIIPILIFPVFGALFYLFFNRQITGKLLNKEVIREIQGTEGLVGQKSAVLQKLFEENTRILSLARYLRKVTGSAVHENTAVKYYASGEDAFDTIMDAIRNAKRFVFLEFFIINQGYMWESVLEVLKEKVKEGIEVRVLYDGMSDYFSLPRHYAKQIEELGIQCMVFSPIYPLLSTVQNNRDHRKIIVVDGEVAFTGGINLADEYINLKERFGYWKDCCIMLKGDAVADFTMMFLQMWNVVCLDKSMSRKEIRKRTPDRSLYLPYINYRIPKLEEENLGYVVAYDDNPLDDELVGEAVYADILNTATRYVHIMTPYLVLDHEMLMNLCYTAKRGVDVKIIMPSIPDKKYAFWLAKTYYKELIAAGVKIYEFQPGFIHSKLFVSDDEKAVAGSINMDIRSMYLSFECAAFIYKNKEIPAMEADYQKTLESCVLVTKEMVDKLPFYARVFGKLMRLFAPLM